MKVRAKTSAIPRIKGTCVGVASDLHRKPKPFFKRHNMLAVKDSKYHLELTIPGLPKRVNQSYAQGWQKRMVERRRWKRTIGVYLHGQLPQLPLKLARLTLTRCSSMEPDYDGLVSSFKCVIDALIQHGVIIDDKMSVIGIPEYRWEKVPKNKGCIKITVSEA